MRVETLDFNAWFPSMRHLELGSNQFPARSQIDNYFPFLEQMGISLGGIIQLNSIQAALQLNPQLRSISLDRIHFPYSIRYASEYLPHLFSLKLRGKPNDFCTFTGNIINFKTVKKLEIGFLNYRHDAQQTNVV